MPSLVYIGPAVLEKEDENVKSLQRQQRQQLLRQRTFRSEKPTGAFGSGDFLNSNKNIISKIFKDIIKI